MLGGCLRGRWQNERNFYYAVIGENASDGCRFMISLLQNVMHTHHHLGKVRLRVETATQTGQGFLYSSSGEGSQRVDSQRRSG